jgi:hypothetical protein
VLDSPVDKGEPSAGEMADRIDNCSLGLALLPSGICILTWSLIRHPNTIAFEECGWTGNLAIDLPFTFRQGTERDEN